MAAINQIIKGNNKDNSGFNTPELVILNKKKNKQIISSIKFEKRDFFQLKQNLEVA